jgi:hypothetical protein
MQVYLAWVRDVVPLRGGGIAVKPHPFRTDTDGGLCLEPGCYAAPEDPIHGGGQQGAPVVRRLRALPAAGEGAREAHLAGGLSDDEAEVPDGRVEIDAGIGDLKEASAAAKSALVMANEPPRYFSHGGALARIEEDDDGRPFTRPMNADRLRHHLARAAWYYKKHPLLGLVEVRPPMDVVRDLLASPDRMWPTLRRIIGTPVFAADGTLCQTVGYNASAQAWFHPHGLEVPAVPADPDGRDVATAADLILEMFQDFPFAEDADKAHAVALTLQPFVRELIDGPTPLYLIEKPTPGTGATLLATAALWPAVGAEAPSFTEAGNEEEWRKRITSTLRGAPEAILIENLHGKVNSASLAAALTIREWGDRLLGVSEMLRLPVRCVWIATANNPELSTEMVRRSIRIRMDTGLEEPWTRDPAEFLHPDLRGWLHERRPDLVNACLLIVQSWITAGRPLGTASLGMYESWAVTMGGILASIGLGKDFLANLPAFYEAMLSEDEDFRIFVQAWWEAFGDKTVGVAQLFHLAEKSGLDLGTGTERSQQTKLAGTIRRHRDRRFGSWFVRRVGIRQGAAQWRLEAR